MAPKGLFTDTFLAGFYLGYTQRSIMTALLTIQCDDYSILLSDRRTSHRTPTGETEENSDEYGKSGIVYCVDGIFAYAFSGIAENPKFKMNSWLVRELLKTGKPKSLHKELILDFKTHLSQKFQTIPLIHAWKPNERKLTVVFAGYFWTERNIYGRTIVISNFESFDADGCYRADRVPNSAFQEFVWTQSVPMSKSYSEVSIFGNWRPFAKRQTEAIATLVVGGKSRETVVEKAISIMRKMSGTPRAHNNIGKQIDEIFIPHDPSIAPIGKSHTSKPTNQVWVPPRLIMSGESVALAPALVLTATDSMHRAVPWVVQKVRMRHRCPCGSGKRYRACHGDPKNRKIAVIETDV